MADRPILFSGPMVRAILDGTKTQTRRVMRTQPTWDESRSEWSYESRRCSAHWSGPKPIACASLIARDDCPYGAPGDRLWVRETFDSRNSAGERWKPKDSAFVVFRDGAQMYSDGTYSPPLESYAPGAFDLCRWRPSIHMPRWASRITLEVTAVRVERLQDISEDDARAEGVEPVAFDWRDYMPEREAPEQFHKTSRASFFSLWESINGTASLAADPWVWVVSFQVQEVRRG